jgi:hypothetical protein
LYNTDRDQFSQRAEFDMLKTIHATALVTTLLCVAGCSSSPSTAQNNGVANMLANTMPGQVSQNGQTVLAPQSTTLTPNEQNIIATANAVNHVNTPTTGVTHPVTPGNILAAMAAAMQTANAATNPQGFQTFPNAIGPGPFMMVGPHASGIGIVHGPPAFFVQPSN